MKTYQINSWKDKSVLFEIECETFSECVELAFKNKTNLYEVDLRWAVLCEVIGNNKEIKTIQSGLWVINYTDTVMSIGCQQHNIEDWFNFDDDRINYMDINALKWWRKWKPILRQIIDKS
jgi:hypothetical protein